MLILLEHSVKLMVQVFHLDTQTQSFTVDNVDSITNYSIPNIQYNNNYEITIQAKNNLNENYGPSETINIVGPELNINYFESGEQLLNLILINYPQEDIYLDGTFLNYDILSYTSLLNNNLETSTKTFGINALESYPEVLSSGTFLTRLFVSGFNNNYSNEFLIGNADNDYNDIVYNSHSNFSLTPISNNAEYINITESNYQNRENLFITGDRKVSIHSCQE